MGLRDELAQHIRDNTDALAVQAFPAEVTAVPAVVLHPAPGVYWEPFTFGPGNVPTLAWALVIEIIAPRPDPQAALDNIEALAADILRAIASFTPGAPRFQALGDIGEVVVGDSPAVSAQMSVLVPYPLPESP